MEDEPRDLTQYPSTLVYITQLPGNGVVAGYGWLKEFGFSVPVALRRLADRIEQEGATAQAAAQTPVAQTGLAQRALRSP